MLFHVSNDYIPDRSSGYENVLIKEGYVDNSSVQNELRRFTNAVFIYADVRAGTRDQIKHGEIGEDSKAAP